LATRAEIHALAARGELELHGGESEMWLGVPMMRGDHPIGVVAVQTYDETVRYGEQDKETLIRLSQGIANAIERKRAEAALRRSEAQLAETMLITRLGNWEYDVQGDMFTFTDQFYAMLRTTAAREGGYNISSSRYAERFVHPDDLPLVELEMRAAVQTADPNYERQLDHRVIFGDGEPGYVTVRIRVIKDAANRTVKTYGANLDITERKRAEMELQSALAETRRLETQARQSEQQVTALNRRLTREGWRDYLDAMSDRISIEATGGDDAGAGAGNGKHAAGGGDRENGKGTILVPIELRGEVIGEIELEPDDSGGALSDADLGLVAHVAENIGLALDNARLFTETQRRVTELDALNSISQAVSAELDLESLLNVIGDQLQAIFDVQNAYIALYDRASQTISLPYFVNDNQRVSVDPILFGEGITSHIIRTRTPLVINRDTDAEMEKLGAKTLGNPARSYLGVPIIVGDDVTGVISIQSLSREEAFDRESVRLMETVAATVGAAIQNAQLYGAMQQEVVTRQRAEEEIKLSLREKEVLLKEIHHRVKNNLQIITSLLNLQSSQLKDPDAMTVFRESQSRVRSMALIHEKLYQSKDLAHIDFDGYVRDLMVYLFRSYAANPDQIRTHIATNDMYLTIDTAIPCGLIISELVTNTIKYAFPEGKRGELHVALGPADDGHLALLVKDNGVGFPEGFDWRSSDSLGLQLVNTLSSQLHGTIEVDGRGGTSFRITFPG
jgi:two-component sensor histidine kinase/PAS domain-containing protein